MDIKVIRRFDVAGAKLWNYLPLELKAAGTLISFKPNLKTYVILQAYGPGE